MTALRITCLSHDHDQLDRSVARILAALPAREVADVQVQIGEKQQGAQTRTLLLHEPSEKIAGILARIDVPKAVTVQVRAL